MQTVLQNYTTKQTLVNATCTSHQIIIFTRNFYRYDTEI